ncbi:MULTISPECIES: PadR family transcriptional regulator [Spirosoma]|uniref:PadR family transcriptional regulator n=1 Tax=Spirosoma liriopis TaxID=2937440 RepID=A0ABT0HMN5_9BACT|nr:MULTISPECIES: PadR family transcriptional regulator [Spirosoma]MCK8493426.1 PadR family transcriptional regulator [Spirosoma liriopis]UHG92807.1 PadR family transcriptional regulator [Spirosoma oryzicola]
MGRPYLGEFEELVLLTVAVLQGDAYGVTIAAELKLRTSRTISLSGVHIALYRLEEKGFVGSELGGATTTRGGRRKRLFTITSAGKETLSEMRNVRNQLWDSIPNPSLT